ncbi:hypothetical protein [Microcoleus sp. CAWBG556]|nr:hypothetical protein [Microcoleus sp. CAWBG556]
MKATIDPDSAAAADQVKATIDPDSASRLTTINDRLTTIIVPPLFEKG